jgi:hypothetical protein
LIIYEGVPLKIFFLFFPLDDNTGDDFNGLILLLSLEDVLFVE